MRRTRCCSQYRFQDWLPKIYRHSNAKQKRNVFVSSWQKTDYFRLISVTEAKALEKLKIGATLIYTHLQHRSLIITKMRILLFQVDCTITFNYSQWCLDFNFPKEEAISVHTILFGHFQASCFCIRTEQKWCSNHDPQRHWGFVLKNDQ